jgi:TonB family protein
LSGNQISLETARHSLQMEYPQLLLGFDLHQGAFTVAEAVWDTLSPASRAAFLDRCSRSRGAVVRQTAIKVRADGDLLATFDGGTAVVYGGSSVASTDLFQNRDRDVKVTEGASAPSAVLLSIPRPIYPPEALRAGLEGTVLIKARIGPDGIVEELKLIDGGIAIFNPAAIDAVRRARFRPFSEGEACDSLWVQIPMRFSILGRRNLPEIRGGGIGGGLVDAVERQIPSPVKTAK